MDPLFDELPLSGCDLANKMHVSKDGCKSKQQDGRKCWVHEAIMVIAKGGIIHNYLGEVKARINTSEKPF